MKVHKENMERVTKMVAEEVQTLKTQCDRERENAKILKLEAERVRHQRFQFNCVKYTIELFHSSKKLTSFRLSS